MYEKIVLTNVITLVFLVVVITCCDLFEEGTVGYNILVRMAGCLVLTLFIHALAGVWLP